MTRLGIFTGQNPNSVTGFEAWLGRKVDLCSVYMGEASWQDFDGSLDYQLGRFTGLGCPLMLSVPLIPAGATLRNAATGAYNGHYRHAARKIADARQEPTVYVRTGWEQNGDWMTWSAQGREQDFIGAFRQFATCFRAVSLRFRLIWCPCIGQNDPAPSFPGDEFVDVIGLDIYHQPKWDPRAPVDAWNYMVTRRYGLQWHLEFADAHAKPMAYPEWGVCSERFGPYIIRMADWLRAGNVLFHAYWDSNSSYAGKLSNGQYPATGAAFQAAFGH